MSFSTCLFVPVRVLRLALAVGFGCGAVAGLGGATAAAEKPFNVPADDAPVALKQYAQQAGVELLYSAKEIAGMRTNAVKGVFTPREALARMLTGTKLIATPGKHRGAVAITRAPDPNG